MYVVCVSSVEPRCVGEGEGTGGRRGGSGKNGQGEQTIRGWTHLQRAILFHYNIARFQVLKDEQKPHQHINTAHQ